MGINKRLKYLLLQATMLLLLSSCTVMVPYSSALQSKYGLTDKDIEGLQFYLSHQIVLYKASSDGQASTGDGGLIVHSDRQRHEVILRKGTPGVVEEVYGDRLVVSFELGDDRHLVFGNKYFDEPYYLMAEEWERKHGRMQYSGTTYYAEPGSGSAFLKIKLRKVRQLEKKTRIATGRRL